MGSEMCIRDRTFTFLISLEINITIKITINQSINQSINLAIARSLYKIEFKIHLLTHKPCVWVLNGFNSFNGLKEQLWSGFYTISFKTVF